MKICVIGTGYVGLVSGACFANSGNHVICADIDEGKIARLNDGILPIYEPGLNEIVRHNMAKDRLHFTTDVPSGIKASDLIFIAVGTPTGEDGSADLQHVLAVAETIGTNLDVDDKIVIVKSTVPVGTCDLVRTIISNHSTHKFQVVSNPEFLKEGAAVQDFLKPDRVVVGCESDKVKETMEELYAPFVRTGKPILTMDLRSSEMSKYASNAMLATKISFINEVSRLCEKVGADVDNVRRAMSTDQRIGPHFIFPGCGYGGSCFPKDIKALVQTGSQYGVEMEVLEAVESVNARQKKTCYEKIFHHYGEDLSGKTIAVWGLAFKPRTDDMREAPSLVTIEGLVKAGATVHATDPVALETAQPELAHLGDKVKFFADCYECIDGADALVVCTEWNDYRNPDFDDIKERLTTPLVVDGRNIYRPEKMERMGFIYYSIGRPTPAGA
jgi:UDPglucose 6-dehydrogenase